MTDDLRQALRRLRARPGTALLATGMLALAIGITSAMFTVVDAMLLRPAPFRDPSTLVRLAVGTDDKNFNANLDLPLIAAWRTNRGFASVHAVAQESASFGEGESRQTFAGARVTAGLFEDLGVRPVLGRTFERGEGRAGADDRVMLSETIWRARYASDPTIVGRRVEISGTSMAVVGVLPASFVFPFSQTRVWRPLDLDQPPPIAARPNYRVYGYARLARDVPRDEAARQATDLLHATDPTAAGKRTIMRPIASGYLDQYSADTVRALAAGVGLVFLALCVNVTNLMLARLNGRKREFAVCSALGASRGRLMREAAFEQGAIGLIACVLGLAAGAGLVSVARAYLPTDIISRTLNPLDLDLRAVAATSLFSGLAIVIAGIVPAWVGTSELMTQHAHLISRTVTLGRRARTTTTILLVAEIAFAVALSVAAGLQLRSFVNLLREDRGLDAERLITFGLSLPASAFADGSSRYAYAEQIQATVGGLPGVEGTALSFGIPPSAGSLHFYNVTPDTPSAAPVFLVMNGYSVTPDFFRVYGIQILHGRAFQVGETTDAIIISQSMARALWPSTSAVDHTLSFDGRTYRVTGVVTEIRNPLLDPRQDQPELYRPLLGPSGPAASGPTLASTSVSLTVRCGAACPPADLMRSTVKSASPLATVGSGHRIADDYVQALARPRTGAIVALAFAVIALLAVGGGLFAVLSRAVLQREREFGIRAALGATPSDLRQLVRRNSLVPGAIGLGLGVVLASLLARILAAVQYRVQLADPMTWTAVIGAIGLTILVASWRPARRAMRADPVRLLREE